MLKDKIKNIFLEAGFNFSEAQFSEIEIYINEISAWNAKCDLTSFSKEEDIAVNLFLDSFSLAKFIKEDAYLLDVGSGGGFPGLALKIMYKEMDPSLIDASSKKIVFLNHISRLLKFTKVDTHWGRAEEFGRDEKYREKYEVVVSKALAEMNVLAELCLPFVKIGGLFLAPKGKSLEEIDKAKNAIELLGGKIGKIEKVNIKNLPGERHIIVIRKESATPQEYPRKPGIPAKRPLK